MSGRARNISAIPTATLEAALSRRKLRADRRADILRELSARTMRRALTEEAPEALVRDLTLVYCRTCNEPLTRKLNAHTQPYFVHRGSHVSDCPQCCASLSDTTVRRASDASARVRWKAGWTR